MNYLKFLLENEQTGRTLEGYPFRDGKNYLLTRQEHEDEVQLSLDADVKIFDLSNDEDLIEYTKVLDKIANGAYVQLAPDREIVDKQRMTWKVLCRYAEIKGDIPAHIKRRAGVL